MIDFHRDNVYTWWTNNRLRFPKLASIAQKYLCAPPTSVASERLFSGAGLIYDEARNRLSPDNAEMVLFVKKNFEYINCDLASENRPYDIFNPNGVISIML